MLSGVSPMSHQPSLPTPPRERWPLAVALVALLAGVALLGVALTGSFSKAPALPAPPAAPAVVVLTPTPTPTAAAPVTQPAAAPAAQAKETPAQQTADVQRFSTNERAHVPAGWVSGFYGIYAQAQKAYGVNWLLIASVHKQETAFSTHPTTYHGLNFAKCCAGPMQFNVTNGGGGTLSTWARYKDSFTRGARPANYPHQTAKHPSIYDDYDAIMAAAALLRDSGAGKDLDAAAWNAAYSYYGHDLTGVSYANEVLARAIGWGQKSFCINCVTDDGLLSSVDAAWGAPVRVALDAAAAVPKATEASKKAKKQAKKG
jgi:hypothetical protein